MNVYSRLLDADKEQGLLIEAYHWRDTAPQWFRECLDIWKETFDEYLDNAKNELHYGIFKDEEMIAVVRLIEAKPGLYNIHLSAKKKADPVALLQAATALRDFLFGQGVLGFYGYLPTQNRGISKLYEALGFVDTGIRIFKGVVHDKLVQWKHYAIAAPGL